MRVSLALGVVGHHASNEAEQVLAFWPTDKWMSCLTNALHSAWTRCDECRAEPPATVLTAPSYRPGICSGGGPIACVWGLPPRTMPRGRGESSSSLLYSRCPPRLTFAVAVKWSD
jgi:hypothetical protein